MLSFGPWLPDQPELGEIVRVAKNVIPAANGYKQFKSFANTITALAERVQGAIALKAAAGGAYIYAGTASKLYGIAPGATSATDFSKAGGYNCSPGERWSGTRFGDTVLMSNIDDPIQAKTAGSVAAFADLSSDAPKARLIAIMNSFLVTANIDDPVSGTLPNGTRWSAADVPGGGIDVWPTVGSDTAISLESDLRELPDGGAITGLVGGELGGYYVCEAKIYRSTYVGTQSNLFFDIQPVEEHRGTRFSGSVASDGRRLFYLGDDGFWLFDGLQSIPIGNQKVDRWFLADLNSFHVPRLCNALDPVNKLVMYAYPNASTVAGEPTRILIIAYGFDEPRFAYVETTLEWLFSGMDLGYNLDTLDSLGFNLDTFPYSLDDPLLEGGAPLLMGVDTSHQIGTFTGAALDAQIKGGFNQLIAGRRALVTSTTPVVTAVGTSLSVTVNTKERIQDTATAGTASSTNIAGECLTLASGRYHQFQADIVGGFEDAVGVDPTFADDGAY